MRLIIAIAVLFYSCQTSAQIFLSPAERISGVINEYSADNYGDERPAAFRGNATYQHSVHYDSTARRVLIAAHADASNSYGTMVYVYRIAAKGVKLGEYIPSSVIPDTDNHKIGQVAWVDGTDIAYRVEVHYSPIETYTGQVGSLVDNGNFRDSLTYPTLFQLNDTLGILIRQWIEQKQHLYVSTDTAQSFSFLRRTTAASSGQTQPYPFGYGDWIDGSIFYGGVAYRNYDFTKINYFRFSLYKMRNFGVAMNVAETDSTSGEISLAKLTTDYEVVAVDTASHEVRTGGGYVDASDNLHVVFWRTDTDSIYLYRTSGTSDTIITIPINSNFVHPGTEPNNITQIDDWAELVHKGGDRYDLFIFNSGNPIYQYSTEDAFATVSGPFQITPDGMTIRSMMGMRNYRPGAGWPYVLAFSAEVSGITGKQLLYVYEYTPK